jgi:hypothetical protein
MTYITLSLSLSKELNSFARLLSLVAIIDLFLNITLLGNVVTSSFLIWMPSKHKIVFTFLYNQWTLRYYHIGEPFFHHSCFKLADYEKLLSSFATIDTFLYY